MSGPDKKFTITKDLCVSSFKIFYEAKAQELGLLFMVSEYVKICKGYTCYFLKIFVSLKRVRERNTNFRPSYVITEYFRRSFYYLVLMV